MNSPPSVTASPSATVSRSAAPLTIADAQRAMRHAYLDGAAGVLVSGLVWLLAGLVCHWQSPGRAIWALFIGGALIHPVSVLLLKALGRPGNHERGNPFGALALATTVWMILCLPLAYAAALVRIEWFFPAMLFVIGGRYLCFSTMYGMRLYLACGAALALAGFALGSARAEPALAALVGGAIELGFGLAILASARRRAAG